MTTNTCSTKTPSRFARHLLGLCTVVSLLACGSGGLPQVTPSVKIDSPTNGSTVNLPLNSQVAVNFETNYTLKAPGTCSGLSDCGHVYVLVDSTNCNQPGLPYNALGIASPVEADLSKCAQPKGPHTITLELHNDDDSPVLTLIGNPVTDAAMITAQ